MSQIGFYHNMQACTGCRTCQIACKDKNNLDVGTIFRTVDGYSVGSFPAVKAYFYSASCNHCEVPACFAVCPMNAISKEADGSVVIDVETCNGCEECIAACPYGVPKVIPTENIVNKCDACITLRANGENPACVDSCPQRALDFGEIEDLEQMYGADLVNTIAPLASPDATMPSIRINAKPIASEADYKEIYMQNDEMAGECNALLPLLIERYTMTSKQNEQGVVLAAREYLYLLFTRIFGQEPGEPLLDALCASQTYDALWLFIDENALEPFQQKQQEWIAASAAEKEQLLDAMQSEYTRALIGPGELVAYPWESAYVEDAPLLFQAATLEVRKDFKKSGLELVTDTNVPDDGLAFELYFMSTLAHKSLEALDDEDKQTLNELLVQQAEFLGQHILKWVPQYCEDIQQLPQHVYIPALAYVLELFVSNDAKFMELLHSQTRRV